ncbi:hypothetical protein FACS189454_01310 [Planctomycetales bacterium]|nr:hypothetical protein FACS189454_01310 [Planctomycetales bacterium]
MQPEPLQTMSAESMAFKERLGFYRQLVLERSRLKNQLKQATEQFVIKETKSPIKQADQKGSPRTSEAHCGQCGVESEAEDSQVSAGHRREGNGTLCFVRSRDVGGVSLQER